ncbi:MAG: ROK family transcriptional regulator [Terracoccus sp.]
MAADPPRSGPVPAHGRRPNLALVLQALHSGGPMSRADLARRLGLTKVSVSDLVADLLARGHAVELGPSGVVRPGKPATLVDLNRTGLQTVGLDLAAPGVLRAAVLDLDGTILARDERTLGPVRGAAAVDLVLELALGAVAAATAPVLGLGVGTPGIVRPGGVVDTAPNLGWTDVPLGDLLAEATGLPVLVCNDADAAVHAEHTLGGGEDLVLVKIGSGVGCGVVVGGRRVRGAHSGAGEIGHVTVGTDGGARCGCGRYGCLETWLAVPHLEAALAAGGSSGSSGVLREAGQRLGIALAPVVGVLDLAEVVLSGPEHLLAGPLLQSVDDTLRSRMLTRPTAELVVRLAGDPTDIVLRGASVLVLWDQLGIA